MKTFVSGSTIRSLILLALSFTIFSCSSERSEVRQLNSYGQSTRIKRDKVVNFTSKALSKVKELQAIDEGEFLRVDVLPGFVYDIRFEDAINESDDILDEQDGIRVLVSMESRPYLLGATIDWKVDSSGKEGFYFENPNALKEPDLSETNRTQ